MYQVMYQVIDQMTKQQTTSRYYPPATIYQINVAVRHRQLTGRCPVCGEPAFGPGVTCKRLTCISDWVGTNKEHIKEHINDEPTD